ncbi:substrate-binding periplasmic protein [Simiduia agarivorans]|nr:amino acid ABC transporter substrate-binding protein [Simiduia agarivorans]
MLIELVNRASEQAGIAVHYHPLPWKRCLTMVEQGGIDGALALVWNQDRQARFAYPLNAAGKVDRQRRIWQGEYLIMLPARSPVQWDGKQFSHLEGGMASPLGYASSEKLRSLNAFAFDSPPDKGLLLVSKNRLPGYVVQKEIGFKNLQSLGIEKQVKVLPIPFMTEDWYLVFSSDLLLSQPQLTARLWAAVARERIRLQSGKSTP